MASKLTGHKHIDSAMAFKSFWYGSFLSPREWLCLKSFVDRGLPFHLYVYDDTLEVPEGVELKDATALYDEDRVFFYQDGESQGSVSAFSNMFRYKLLYEFGGWWVDMDVVYTGHPIPSDPPFFGWQRDGKVGSAILHVQEQGEVMRRCLEIAEQLGEEIEWGEAGPNLLTRVLRDLGQADQAVSSEYAYPVSWENAPSLYLPSKRTELEARVRNTQAPFLHLWNESLNRAGIEKAIAPPKNSYLGKIARTLDFDWSGAEVNYSPDNIERLAHHYRRSQQLDDARGKLNAIRNARLWKLVSTVRSLFGLPKLTE